MSAGKVCFNAKCGATSSEKWRSGWLLRTGQFADLCDYCGSAFEQMRFCETFHLNDDGWRTCKTCDKPVHCGCISSINLFMHLDGGGIECMFCASKSDNEIPAYFPSILQPEGVPMKIQDADGKDWVFRFRFCPNNNSGMYVLEGVNPCMQSMQLHAGDTVNFSRVDPEGKIIMGFRKASNSNVQEGQPSKIGNRASPSSGCDLGLAENMSVNTDLSGISLHPRKRKTDSSVKEVISQFNDSDTDFRWYRNDEAGGKSKERRFFQSGFPGNKMESHNLGSKNKRLRIDNDDVLELNVTWKEAQDLFCPPLTAVPSVVVIEGHEFEEYEEPPVFGKGKTSHTKRSRASSSGPHEMSFKDFKSLPEQSKGSKKKKSAQRKEDLGNSSCMNASSNAATLGKKTTSVTPTTKHPRHRVGCTCIVCIQPPSGKGPKHKPSCTCSVCVTVKRRFKTLMMRRRKLQSENGAENTRKKYNSLKEERDVNSGEKQQSDMHSRLHKEFMCETPIPEFKKGLTKLQTYLGNEVMLPSDLNVHGSYNDNKGLVKDNLVGKGGLDLNSHPAREDESFLEIAEAQETMLGRLLDDDMLPLDMYVEQHDLPSLMYPPQISNTLGFHQSASEYRVDQTSSVQNEDQISKKELISDRTTNDVKSLSI